MTRVIERLHKAIREASVYNPEVQVPPACILWPDREHQWEAVVPRLQNEMAEMFVLGQYEPEKRVGPAIWLKCVLSRTPEEIAAPGSQIPVFYLPGIGRQELRAVENCPDHLKPIAELQYRGVIWSQINAKDWTVLAFLKSDQGGLGLDVAQDRAALIAMQMALHRLMDEDIELLRGKRLDKDYFHTLLTSGDPVRDLLQWLDQGDAFRVGRGENEWRGFVEVCKSQFAFNPEKAGILTGAARLASHEGPWNPIWERFCEAPKRYPNIPSQIRKCAMPQLTLFSDASSHGGWPQWNEDQEESLRKDLSNLSKVPPHEARKRISDLDSKHRDRRQLPWAELGESPLACALEYLQTLAHVTESPIAAGTVEDLSVGHQTFGWKGDDAVIRALSCLDENENYKSVATAIRTVYAPWAEESARYLQGTVDQNGYPGGAVHGQEDQYTSKSLCLLFVDGLRFDIAKRLAERISNLGHHVEEKPAWTALPTVTATCKPAVTPVRHKIRGNEANADFEPHVAGTEQSLKGGYQLRKLLLEAGWEVLEKGQTGTGDGQAWCEIGHIDEAGHERGWKIARDVNGELKEICDRVAQLLGAGWKTVRIVTDHGWLLLPGGLPKTDLPTALVENKWGRCAALKPGAVTDERLFPWYWNSDQSFALADGISCYRNGEEYAHGGLSLQECFVLELTVSSGVSEKSAVAVEITDVVWKGLRCTVALNGQFSGLSLDIRSEPGNSLSSLVVSVKQFKDNGTASVVVENEELDENPATMVILDQDGTLVAQVPTVVGGEGK